MNRDWQLRRSFFIMDNDIDQGYKGLTQDRVEFY